MKTLIDNIKRQPVLWTLLIVSLAMNVVHIWHTTGTTYYFDLEAQGISVQPIDKAQGTYKFQMIRPDQSVDIISDRPKRITHTMSLEQFVKSWPRTFETSEPNGFAHVFMADNQSNIAGQRYEIKMLDANLSKDKRRLDMTVQFLGKAPESIIKARNNSRVVLMIDGGAPFSGMW